MSSYKHAIAEAFEQFKAKYHEPRAELKINAWNNLVHDCDPIYELEGSRLSPLVIVGEYPMLQVLRALTMGFSQGYEEGRNENADFYKMNLDALATCGDV